jgi:peroxiredoxin
MSFFTALFRLVPAILVAGIVSGPVRLAAAPRVGLAAPDFKVVTAAGQQVSLEKYRGQVVILDFFATWCQPCRESIPHLVGLNRKYSKQGLQILGLSADEDGERAVRAFVEQHRISYPVATAGESVLADYGVRSVPVMFVIDKRGKVAEVYRGFTDAVGRSSEQLVRKLLAEK